MSKVDEMIAKLTRINSDLEKEQTNRARLEGELNAKMGELKALGYNSIEEAEEGLKERQESLDAIEKELEDGYDRLKEEFNW